MSYIDAYVLAVPMTNKELFIEHADHIDALFLELGATRVVEAWGDDVPIGKQTDFRRAVQAKETETVALSWVEWPDKETRDRAVAKMDEMAKTDEKFDESKYPVPFDGTRMILGGFELVAEF